MRFTRRRLSPGLTVAGLLALSAPTVGRAADTSLMASEAWSRPTISAAMAGVVYVTVTDGGAPTALVSVATPIAAQAEMHQSLEQNGMMEMLPIKSLPIAPGSPITFSPGGYHIMLTGLRQPLSAGQTFPLTLTFADGSTITTTVTVQSMTAAGPSGAMGSMGGMKMSP
jgi:periplasmic copper chaperone A